MTSDDVLVASSLRPVPGSPGAPVPATPAGVAAIYCRKSKKGDRQEVTVTRQKKLALADCAKLGLVVSPDRI